MANMNNAERHGRITSSKISLVIKKGRAKDAVFSQGALTYFQQKRSEKRIGRTLSTLSHSQAMMWGLHMEMVVFSYLGLDYKINSQDTTLHPDPNFKNFWSGSCDLLVPGHKVGEIKAFQLERGLALNDCLMKKSVELFKKDFPEIYWQIVSNCILEEVLVGEIISFIPYYSQMKEIQEMAADIDGPDQWKTRFISEKDMMELPCIPDDGYYSNITSFEFDVPEEDIEFLTKRVELAKPYLNINYGI